MFPFPVSRNLVIFLVVLQQLDHVREVHEDRQLTPNFSILGGQVDWFLSSGGGPLEIQYLNMLGAHSSYWSSPDFIRMIVIEVCRKPGRQHALPNMRAVKAVRKVAT